jgi:hypothetical protein
MEDFIEIVFWILVVGTSLLGLGILSRSRSSTTQGVSSGSRSYVQQTTALIVALSGFGLTILGLIDGTIWLLFVAAAVVAASGFLYIQHGKYRGRGGFLMLVGIIIALSNYAHVRNQQSLDKARASNASTRYFHVNVEEGAYQYFELLPGDRKEFSARSISQRFGGKNLSRFAIVFIDEPRPLVFRSSNEPVGTAHKYEDDRFTNQTFINGYDNGKHRSGPILVDTNRDYDLRGAGSLVIWDSKPAGALKSNRWFAKPIKGYVVFYCTQGPPTNPRCGAHGAIIQDGQPTLEHPFGKHWK